MSDKKLAIVLGGTVPHQFLIRQLQCRGYYVALIDYHDNPPAASVADRHIQESTLNQEAVLEIAKRERASLVISGCVDQANVTACYVAEELGLPAPYTYETALSVTDKSLMKSVMARGAVPTAYHEVVTREAMESYVCQDFPKVVKPCDCNGSKGVRKVHSQRELIEALASACRLSRTGKSIVEDFNVGIEVSGYFYIGKDRVTELYIKRKSLPSDSSEAALQSFISLGPERVSAGARAAFQQAVAQIASAFNLVNTPLLVQANIDGDAVTVIEFAPRVGGGLAFREIEILTGVDLINAVLASYLGEDLDLSRRKEPEGFASVVHLYGMRGKFASVKGMEDLLEKDVVEEFHLHKTPGMPMSCDDLSSRNRVVGAIIRGSSVRELQNKTQRMAREIQIFSDDGVDVFNRGILQNVGELR